MSNRIIKHQRIKRLPLAVALVGCLYGASAFAQEATDQEKKDQKEPAKTEATTLDKITVTGSLLKRVEYDLTTPVQVIQADTAISVGQVGTAEFLQKSTVAAGYTQINHQFSGLGSPPFSRTLTRRPIEAMRSVHVEAKEVQCGVQAWRG